MISLVLVVLAYDEVWSCILYLNAVRRESGSYTELWMAFTGRPTPLAIRIGEQMTKGVDCDRAKDGIAQPAKPDS